MLLFLDLDGVLRRHRTALYRLEADCLAAFGDALRWIPEAEVVITSSWREVIPLPQLRALFSEDFRGRIVGVTPLARLREDHCRYQEVLAYLRLHGLSNRPWIAIDDDREHYPAGCELLLIDPTRVSIVTLPETWSRWPGESPPPSRANSTRSIGSEGRFSSGSASGADVIALHTTPVPAGPKCHLPRLTPSPSRSGLRRPNHFAPATSFSNLGFLRSVSKLGSIASQRDER